MSRYRPTEQFLNAAEYEETSSTIPNLGRVNTANNQISGSGYAYDAAGNMTSDGVNCYTYDAEGNVTEVIDSTNCSNSPSATYTYNALNQRVRVDAGSTATEFVFNANGQRVSTWNGNTHAQIQGQYYAGSRPVAYYIYGTAHFQHQDWLGTERVLTGYSGATVAAFASLPFGDGYSYTGDDFDPYHFATLDQDNSANEHAQFREYSNMAGRWFSPDPYPGSYDPTNPQSFNRYAYVMNNPLSFLDPSGLNVRAPFCSGPQCNNGDTDNPFQPGSGSGLSNVFTIWYLTATWIPGRETNGPYIPGYWSYSWTSENLALNNQPQGPFSPGAGVAPSNGNTSTTSTCTISNGRTTGIAPGQAPGAGAFGFVPPQGSVAIDPWALGLPPGGSTNALLGPNASQITFSFSPAPNLPQGYPTTITLGSIVGPKSVRTGGANFNGLFDFDFYGLQSLAAAYAVTSPAGVSVSVTVTYPSGLPISCNGPALDSPIQGPLPSPPGPVPAVSRRLP